MPSLTLVVEIDPKKETKAIGIIIESPFLSITNNVLIPDIFSLKFQLRTNEF